MAFRGLTADRTPLEEFRSRAPRIDRRHEPTSDNYLPLHAFRWIEGEPSGAEICDLKSVGELASHSEGAVRIVSVFQLVVTLELIAIALLQEIILLRVP